MEQQLNSKIGLWQVNNMNLLKINEISKTIKKQLLIENLSFELNEGEILGFLGPNGAGKTTTIKMIAGLFRPDKGEITIAGESLSKNPTHAKSKIGLIIENPTFYEYLSGMENLKQTYRLYGNVNQERLKKIINMVRLENSIHKKVGSYSLGMKQRLGLACALIHDPKVLILDEPTNGLDPDGIRELRELLVYLTREEKKGVLISSHMLAEMQQMCDRFIVIKNGKIISNNFNEKKKHTHMYRLQTTNNEYVLNQFNNLNIQKEKEEIKIECDEKTIQKLIRQIVENNVDINYVNREEVSLEEKFVQTINQSGDINETIIH